MTLASGTRLGPYEILSPIGAGGMGEVYRAHDGRLGRDVAIKVPPAELLQDPTALARFERETRAVAALSHPNILEIHDVGADGGVTYAVTELLHGETLRQRLAAGPLPWPRAVGIAAAMANGLEAAHSGGVVHRDLKPENTFLTEDDRVKILDFGLARLEQLPGADVSPERVTMTETGTLMGTAGYMSPEQVRGEKVDARTDVFSLGCVLYEMLTGIRAFGAGTKAETLVAVLREEPAEVGALVPDLPEGLRLIVGHCIAKSPHDRFQSARDLAIALEDVAKGVTLQSHRLPARRRRTRRLVLGVGVAALALLAAIGLRSILARRPAIDSIAVLPFINASGDPGIEYLSDGISESLLNGLSRFRGLRVPARTSVFAFKGQKDPLQAGRSLDVRAVLTGIVSRRGDNVIVQAEVDDIRRGAQIWGERYDRSAADLLLLENEILRDVSRTLDLRLTDEDRARLARRSTSSVEAYDLYLQGRYHWGQRSPEEISKSIELYEKAIQLDPRFALAYVGLADSYDLLAFYGALPPKDVLPKQRDAARRALEIDDTIAEAHASLADVRYQFEWDW
ncbi:MAG TPA: protein kinase, partial [Thermoanaerobaculia bacterium]|nr:protein kinase [Thermoanaerobaculia bacterium]